MRRLLLHLLQYQFQPSRRSRSRLDSMASARMEMEWLLDHSPGLKSSLAGLVRAQYTRAVKRASIQTDLSRKSFSAECPYTLQQILDDDFLPE
jgi:Domain of unknown function DUF29